MKGAHQHAGLASCATPARQTIGRAHAERFPDDVDPFEIDRLRVVRCAAFRRLQYKTQVFVNQAGDHFRTRLSHTLEVVQAARRLARALHANETLAEVICLAHDLGHPPFGHAGESALREAMDGAGGFEHNAHSLRVVEYLEHPYPPFRGLNLTVETREGIAKHHTPYDHPTDAAGDAAIPLADKGPQPGVEGQIACLADQIAYLCHDLEDAVGADVITADDFAALPRLAETIEAVTDEYGDHRLYAIMRPVLDMLLDAMHADATETTSRALVANQLKTPDAVRRHATTVVQFSASMAGAVDGLRQFLHERFYRHHRLVRMDHKAKHIVSRLFAAYVNEPRLMPPRFAQRVDAQGAHRVVCDYVAGMTDRYCQREYARLFEPFDWE